MDWRVVGILILALVLAVPLAGCNSQPPAVTGDVTLDGQPLADGVITYVPVDQKTPNVEVKIQDGKIARVPAGSYKVRINAAKSPPGERHIKYDSPAAARGLLRAHPRTLQRQNGIERGHQAR